MKRESEVNSWNCSTVNNTALTILKRYGCHGITIVSLLSLVIFDIQVIPNWLKWQKTRYTLAAKDLESTEFHEDLWNCYVSCWFVSTHIQWNSESNLEIWQPYKAIRDYLVLPFPMTMSNLCYREYEQTENALKTQLPSRNKVTLALAVCTSTNKLVTMTLIV